MPYEKVGKNKPVCIADEVPFEIPESWEWCRLGELFITIMGQSPSGESVSDNGAGMEFHQGKIYFGDRYLKHSSQFTSAPSKIAPANSVLLCVRAPVGKVNITDREICIGRGLCSIIPQGGMVADFTYFLLETYEDIFTKQATGTTFIAITGEIVKNQLVPVPPLEEQIRIVKKIENLLPYISEYDDRERKLSKLNIIFPDLLKKSILQQAVMGKLIPQDENDEPASVLLGRIQAEKEELIKAGKLKKDKHESIIYRRDNSHYEKLDGIERCIDDEIPFDIPDSWEWVTLGQIILSVADGPHYSPHYQTHGIPLVSTRNISTGKLDLSSAKYISKELYQELCKRCKPKKGDVLYSKGGTTGIAAVNDTDIEFNVWVHVAVLSLGKNINPYYLAIALNSPLCYIQSQHYTHGTSNRDLGLTRMVKITLPLPPLNEQARIVKQVECIMPKVQAI